MRAGIPISESRRRALGRILAVIVVTLGAVYVFHLAGLALATRQARRVEGLEGAEVVRLATQVAAIETATHDAGGDDFVGEWAREGPQWSRPGDRVLAPVAPTTVSVASPTTIPTPADDPLARLLRWLKEP